MPEGSVTVSMETPGPRGSRTFDSIGTYCVPILANVRTAGNLATQFIPVARIDTVSPGPAAGPLVPKMPGLASSTPVSRRFERPPAVSTAISSAVDGGTSGQRKSIRSVEADKTGA